MKNSDMRLFLTSTMVTVYPDAIESKLIDFHGCFQVNENAVAHT